MRMKHLGNKLIHQIVHVHDQCLSKDNNVEIGQAYYIWTIRTRNYGMKFLNFGIGFILIKVMEH